VRTSAFAHLRVADYREDPGVGQELFVSRRSEGGLSLLGPLPDPGWVVTVALVV